MTGHGDLVRGTSGQARPLSREDLAILDLESEVVAGHTGKRLVLLPGPPRPVHVLGEQVDALYSLAEIGEHHALRVAVVSFAGELNFGFVADPTLLPGLDSLASEVRAEAALLAAATAV